MSGYHWMELGYGGVEIGQCIELYDQAIQDGMSHDEAILHVGVTVEKGKRKSCDAKDNSKEAESSKGDNALDLVSPCSVRELP